MNNMKILITLVAIAIVVGGGAFYGGIKYSESIRQGLRSGMGGGQSGQFGNRNGGNFISGEIISKDDKSVTIKLRDNGSKIVFYSDTTEISKFVDGNSNDLEISKNISVNGETSQDGSVTAQSIQIRPLMFNRVR